MTGTLSIDWAPLVPLALLGGLAALSIFIVALALWRRAPGARGRAAKVRPPGQGAALRPAARGKRPWVAKDA